MFSKGTYNRYLFEISSSHAAMINKYNQMADCIEDPAMKKTFKHFVAQIEIEQEILNDVRAAMQSAG